MKGLNMVDKIALILTIIGGLNWGLVAFDYNLVTMALSGVAMGPTIVYIAVGVSALWTLINVFRK